MNRNQMHTAVALTSLLKVRSLRKLLATVKVSSFPFVCAAIAATTIFLVKEDALPEIALLSKLDNRL